MATRFPLENVYTTGQNLYAIIHGVVAGVRQYWNPTLNTGAGGWEVFNPAHWVQYAIALTEDTGTGYYAADYPANISGVLTAEAYYLRAGGSPATSDTPANNLTRSQGQNVGAVAGDGDVPDTLQQALKAEQRGAATGIPTTMSVPTNLTNAQANAYQGRVVIFTSGAAYQAVARINAYTVTNGVLTLAAALPVAPAAGDTFLIV